MTTRDAMHTFIQNVYAFVIGFGSVTLTIDQSGNWSSKTSTNLALYLLTFLIAAHDWVEFHKKDLKYDSFAGAIPQLLSLLSIGFMFNYCEQGKILLWGLGAISLTFWDIISLFFVRAEKKALNYGTALFFFFLAILYVTIILNREVRDSNHNLVYDPVFGQSDS